VPRAYLFGLVGLLVLTAYEVGSYRSRMAERAAWEHKTAVKELAAVEEALVIERKRQKGVNDALQKQADDLATINNGLRADIERLRKRPRRPSTLPASPAANCEGATGAQLFREDAEFLIGEAARADKCRAALTGCYSAYDAISDSR